MATIKEKLETELALAKTEVAALEATLEGLPEEVKVLSEEVWTKIKALFGVA